jgi:hypothetical protein
MFPVRGRLQRYRLKAQVTFVCAKCGQGKSSEAVGTLDWNWSSPVCEDCSKGILASKDAEPSPPLAPEPQAATRREQPEGKTVDKQHRTVSAKTQIQPAPGRAVSQPARKGWEGGPEALRKSVRQLAEILRARAQGVRLNRLEEQALEVLADDLVMPVALRCAELLVRGDVVVGRLTGEPVSDVSHALTREREAALHQFHQRYERLLLEAQRLGESSDRMSARAVDGEKASGSERALFRTSVEVHCGRRHGCRYG